LFPPQTVATDTAHLSVGFTQLLNALRLLPLLGPIVLMHAVLHMKISRKSAIATPQATTPDSSAMASVMRSSWPHAGFGG